MAHREAAGWHPLPALDYDDPHAVDLALDLLAEAAPDLIFNGMLRYIELSGL